MCGQLHLPDDHGVFIRRHIMNKNSIKNLKGKAKPVKLVHPEFEENFRSIRHAAGWLGAEFLGEDESFIHYEVISFLLRTGARLDLPEEHPLSGLQVMPGRVFKRKKKSPVYTLNSEEKSSEVREEDVLNSEDKKSEFRDEDVLTSESEFREGGSLKSKPLNHITSKPSNQENDKPKNRITDEPDNPSNLKPHNRISRNGSHPEEDMLDEFEKIFGEDL